MSAEERVAEIPFFVHEADMARLERTNKRLFIVVLVLILSLIGTNCGWLVYESQFMDVVTTTTETVDVDTTDGGTAIGFIGDDNEVDYGESES